MLDRSLKAQADLWRSAAQGLATELEGLIELLNQTVTKDNPIPMAPAVVLYKLTVKAVEAVESGDAETMGRALREARQLVGIPGEDL